MTRKLKMTPPKWIRHSNGDVRRDAPHARKFWKVRHPSIMITHKGHTFPSGFVSLFETRAQARAFVDDLRTRYGLLKRDFRGRTGRDHHLIRIEE